ncbi:unnamed protein product [Caenorhabditis angaria]|uniref:Uncharacterized protein n=1 Tax=Caenorhabditis angaria TaxID=860376 RepID=A0A9P1IDV5_9PELO|nr:unnamed protein product [Caenorhabditis angaria]
MSVIQKIGQLKRRREKQIAYIRQFDEFHSDIKDDEIFKCISNVYNKSIQNMETPTAPMCKKLLTVAIIQKTVRFYTSANESRC